ncbi:MAG: cytochrome c-type biogenesis protein, partial [Gemmatimonadota bacterium]
KSVVRDQLAAGRSPEQVRQYFVDTYGEWILLEPEATGFNLAVYILPVVALAAGVAIVIVVLRRWTRDATDAAVASEPSAVPAGGPTDEGVMDDVSSDR